MRLIKTHNAAIAHELAVETVLKHGYRQQTEDGEDTIECEELCIQISEPLSEPRISSRNPLKERAIMEYAKQLVHGGKNEFDYDYHERLFDYCGRDQIEYIIKKLKEHYQSRRALAITWMPDADWIKQNVPCLQLVVCVIRDGKLNMKVVFRSNDILMAFGANVYGLTELQKYIADSLEIEVGTYTHIALIPHIYYIRDASAL
jgi:thymidylate synthase